MLRPTGGEVYYTIKTGEVALSSFSAQLPNIESHLLNIKARTNNAVPIFLGISGVTMPDDLTDETTGFELGSGEETGWFAVSNLNELYALASASTARITYISLF